MNSTYSIDDLLNCIQMAILLEVSGYPKPGNVHRTRDFNFTRYEHFLVGGVVIRSAFQSLCENTVNVIKNNKKYSKLSLGQYILQAIIETKKWQNGGNINLGIILLLVPLCAASCVLINQSINKPNDFNFLRDEVDKILKSSTYKDTINLYKAIKIANPGGMGNVEKYDINNENSLKLIKKDNINLYDIFNQSKEWDSIAMELVSKYRITFDIGLPYFIETFQKCHDINIAIVNTFLKIVSEIPDSLIIRQYGKKIANEYSGKALELISKGGLLNPSIKNKLFKWDRSIIRTNLKINPGTTADLTVSTIFVSLLSGIRF
ncbi:MAG: triphosphoribosyl-dephospho-CoA synthase [Candidatus Helarchaeota archaeon]